MAIGNIIGQSQNIIRPSIFQRPANDNMVMETSDLLRITINDFRTFLTKLAEDLMKMRTTSRENLEGFRSLISSLSSLEKNIRFKFTYLRKDIEASRNDFLTRLSAISLDTGMGEGEQEPTFIVVPQEKEDEKNTGLGLAAILAGLFGNKPKPPPGTTPKSKGGGGTGAKVSSGGGGGTTGAKVSGGGGGITTAAKVSSKQSIISKYFGKGPTAPTSIGSIGNAGVTRMAPKGFVSSDVALPKNLGIPRAALPPEVKIPLDQIRPKAVTATTMKPGLMQRIGGLAGSVGRGIGSVGRAVFSPGNIAMFGVGLLAQKNLEKTMATSNITMGEANTIYEKKRGGSGSEAIKSSQERNKEFNRQRKEILANPNLSYSQKKQMERELRNKLGVGGSAFVRREIEAQKAAVQAIQDAGTNIHDIEDMEFGKSLRVQNKENLSAQQLLTPNIKKSLTEKLRERFGRPEFEGGGESLLTNGSTSYTTPTPNNYNLENESRDYNMNNMFGQAQPIVLPPVDLGSGMETENVVTGGLQVYPNFPLDASNSIVTAYEDMLLNRQYGRRPSFIRT